MTTTKPAYNRAGSRHHIAGPLHAILAALLLMLAPAGAALAQADELSLITDTPAEGFELAIKLSQRGVATTQTDPRSGGCCAAPTPRMRTV